MRVLVTGARGFVGSNLCESLKNIRDGKDRRERYRALLPLTLFEHDLGCAPEELDAWCSEADFVFNLAGVNRPEDEREFMEGNAGFARELLEALERHGNACPVMLASSVQATLEGRYAGGGYGRSKLAAERLFFEHGARTGARTLVYRFPNVYGKWCRPNYNSVVATLCHGIANGLPVTVSDPAAELDLLYVDDLVAEMLGALLGGEHRCSYDGAQPVPDERGGFCYCPVRDRASLGEIAGLIRSFKSDRDAASVQDVTEGSLSKKLYSTYLSYLNPSSLAYGLKASSDERGSFAEFLRTPDRGQVSVNVARPGATKGQHWHHSKWEKFLVVSGEALVRLRRVGRDAGGGPYPAVEYRVSGDEPTVVEAPPGYAHSITNLSGERDLVTVMWANEPFDPERPDTYAEEV